jgi:hypothetical protein
MKLILEKLTRTEHKTCATNAHKLKLKVLKKITQTEIKINKAHYAKQIYTKNHVG